MAEELAGWGGGRAPVGAQPGAPGAAFTISKGKTKKKTTGRATYDVEATLGVMPQTGMVYQRTGETGWERMPDAPPVITPYMQYGTTYGWGDVPKTPQGQKYIETLRAQGRGTPTAAQLAAYESQFMSTDPTVQAEAMKAWEMGTWEKGTGRAAQMPQFLDIPTGLPSSVQEFMLVQGIPPEGMSAEDMAKATLSLRQHYYNKANAYLTGLVETGQSSAEDTASVLKQVGDMLDTGYYGNELPLFDMLRRASAEEWEHLGYTSTERAREWFPYTYEGYYTPEQREALWGGGGGGAWPYRGDRPYRTGQKKAAEPTTPTPTTPRPTPEPPKTPWDWRRIAPPARWVNY